MEQGIVGVAGLFVALPIHKTPQWKCRCMHTHRAEERERIMGASVNNGQLGVCEDVSGWMCKVGEMESIMGATARPTRRATAAT